MSSGIGRSACLGTQRTSEDRRQLGQKLSLMDERHPLQRFFEFPLRHCLGVYKHRYLP